MESKPGKAMTAAAVVFIALTIIFAGLFVYEYSSQNVEKSNYNSLQSSFSSVQSSVVLNDAYAHWDYISIENATLVGGQYTSNAVLDWIGGPLNGTYNGAGNIQGTWDKFFNTWSSVWYYTVSPPNASVNGNKATVTSENQFVLTPSGSNLQVQYINVNYTLQYTLSQGIWKIEKEIWDINDAGFVSPSQQSVTSNYIENLTFTHWESIALRNDTNVMQQYTSNSTLYWIGGPLNGTYANNSQISRTWMMFFNMWTDIWFHANSQPVVTMHGNTVNVSANIQFIGPKSANTSQYRVINVSYNLQYVLTGFNNSTGTPQYLIQKEVFHLEGKTTLNNL